MYKAKNKKSIYSTLSYPFAENYDVQLWSIRRVLIKADNMAAIV